MADNPFASPQNPAIARETEGWFGKTLAVLCLVFFWLLPFSPVLAAVAVAMTRHSTGWARTVAKTGALLSSILVFALVAILLWFLCVAWLRGGFAF